MRAASKVPKERHPILPTFIWVIPLVLALFAGLTWANYQYTQRQSGENDFLSGWAGTRLYFTKGWSPYSPETTAEIQNLAYGHPAAADENPLPFTYPLFAILVFTPFALVSDFAVARALWMSTLEIAILLTALLGISLSHWRIRPLVYVLIAIFALAWFPGFQSILDGNPSIISALLIIAMLGAISFEQDALAAILLALAVYKPQTVLVLIVFYFIWAASKRRWSLIWGFLGVLGIFLAASSLLIPDWIIQYIRMLIEQLALLQMGTPKDVFLYWLPGVGAQLGWLLTILCTLLLIREWRLAAGMNFRWFLWVAYFSLVLTNLIGLPTSVENHALLLPAVILVLAMWDERWGRLGRWLSGFSLVLLSGGLWFLVNFYAGKGVPPDLGPLTFFLVPVFLVIGLYWVRRWAIRTSRLPIQELSEHLG